MNQNEQEILKLQIQLAKASSETEAKELKRQIDAKKQK